MMKFGKQKSLFKAKIHFSLFKMLQEAMTYLQEVKSDSGKVGWNNLPFSEQDETHGNCNAKSFMRM